MRFFSTTFCLIVLCFASQSFPASAFESAEKPISNFIEVSPDLFRGGRPGSQRDIADLKRRGVRTVINLENRPAEIERERQWVEDLGMEYVSVQLSVHETPTDAAIDQVLAVMRDPRQLPVFIHCMYGKDRTGLVFGLHRVEAQNWTARDAYREMLRHGFDPQWVKLVDYFEGRVGN